MNEVRLGLLAALAQHVLESAVDAEVRLDLRLLARVDDHDLVDTLGLERLLHHVLYDRLAQHRKELLWGALGCRQEAGSQTRGRNDCLHAYPFRFQVTAAPSSARSRHAR